MYGIVLILVLIVTGGAIAFIGDHLGSKVGKKRLTLFGLRPKYTSILVTIITGIMITSTTLGIMAIASENVRTALFGMEKLYQEMADAKKEISVANADLQHAKLEQEAADAALKRAKGDLKELQEQKNELEEKNQVLQAGNEALEQAKQELLERYNVLSATNDMLLANQAELQEGNDKLKGDNSKLKDENVKLESHNKDLYDSMQIMREGEIAFHAGEILSAGIIKENRSKNEVKEDLQALINKAQENAYAKLSQHVGIEVKEEDCQLWFYQPDYEAVLDRLTKSKKDTVVRLVAAGNMIRGEAIRTIIQLHDNAVVYEDGAEVLSKGVNLKDNSIKAREEVIIQFLKDVNDTAIKQGMLVDPLTGAVGVIDGNQIYSAIQKLEHTQGMAILSAFAEGKTEILGPLRIRLQVGP